MEKNNDNIRKAIRKAMFESENISESDLLAKAGLNWEVVKPQLINTVNSIIKNIDTDDYAQADKLIVSALGMLKIWRAKIHKGQDMVTQQPYQFTLDELRELLESQE